MYSELKVLALYPSKGSYTQIHSSVSLKQTGGTRSDYVITYCRLTQYITLDYNQANMLLVLKMPNAIMILVLYLRLTCEVRVQKTFFYSKKYK